MTQQTHREMLSPTMTLGLAMATRNPATAGYAADGLAHAGRPNGSPAAHRAASAPASSRSPWRR